MIHLVCLFMKTHLLELLQDNCVDLVCCAFLRKLSARMRNITVFCQGSGYRPAHGPLNLKTY